MDKRRLEKIAEKLRGKFIVLDGPDGCGKTTQQKLLAEKLMQAGVDILTVRDPGDTRSGEAIRKILLDEKYSPLDRRCETLLFMASRAQLVSQKIVPALSAHKTVIADRYVTSTCAYQGACGENIKKIISLARYATQNTWPDLTIILDVSAQTGLKRISGRKFDAMENRGLTFHKRVREIFLSMPEIYPGHIEIINSKGTIKSVHRKILETLADVDF